MSSNSSGDKPLRVMVVDDSAVIRGSLARVIELDSSLKLVSSLSNGEMALHSLQREPVDVIVLDIEMPIMDGLTALPLLKKIDPAVQIIISSTLTKHNAEVSLKAMSLGATDYIQKPSATRDVNAMTDFRRELLDKVKVLGEIARRTGVRFQGSPEAPRIDYSAHTKPAEPLPPPVKVTPLNTAGKKPTPITLRHDAIIRPDIIAIGSSTGGPQALFKVIADMGSGLSQPIVITQHMPPSFTTILADHIARQCNVSCVEARDGEQLEPGRYYVAPGDFHLLIEQKNGKPTAVLSNGVQENFCRPSVDPMLRSLVTAFGKRVFVIILTGMGRDGLKGSEAVVAAGGSVIAQDEPTSVVWGMPGAVATAGVCSAVLPLDQIGDYAQKVAKRAGA